VSKIILQENSLAKLIPEKLAKKYNAFPIEIKDDNLHIEIDNDDIYAVRDLKLATGMNIILEKQDKDIISKKIKKYYKKENKSDEGYARNLFNDILNKAIVQNASDIHIEPFEEYLIIRLRIDGELNEIERLSMDIYPYLSSVIKLDTSMDITEKRLPQDGRVDINIDDSVIDIRASSLPTVYGEKIVLRILKRNSFLKNKEELGFSIEAINKIKNIINKKSGILLVTGATGSGKTTTVYSILNDLRNISKNIMTIEDPVEYKMTGINQIQVNSKLGLNFDVGLRSILRQDPDIIMVGEIRDIETAKIAIRAATTGHLVISTIHTNDAISSIARLIDMQIPPYLINSSLIGIISQKLVRKVCLECSRDILIIDSIEGNINTKVAVGCEMCNNGYLGRTAVYEILEIDDDIKKCIKQMKDYKEIKEIAIKNGMITFEASSKKLINNKITTLKECIMIENMD
jgi:type IV pilus assembly protein PilB